MSIIEEALRRIQDPTLAKTQAADPKAAAAPKKAPAAHSWVAGGVPGSDTPVVSPVTAIGLSVLALGVLLVAGALIWFSRAMAPQPVQMASHPAARAQAQDEFEFAAPPPALPDPVMLTNQSLAEVDPAPARHAQAFAMPWVKIEPKAKDFVLSGVVEGTGEPYAVINDMIIGVGEDVEGAKLVSIDRGAVTLKKSNGQQLVLRIEP